jgi:6-pyruvoyltetrahydropterin/6-carboxytetrahydropterin synthase
MNRFNMEIYKEFSFEAAHRLPHVPEGHKCGRLHGHSYKVQVHISGEPGEKSGWIMDFAEISERVSPIIKELDHYYLNEIVGLENPTSEQISIWLWQKIKPLLPALSKIVISETCTSACIYQGS